MSSRPIYRMGHKRYGIDNCEPQKEAVREGKIEFHALTKGHYPGTLMPMDILPGLNSIGFWDANTSQDWGLNPHRNEGIKIVFFETGTCDLIMGRKTFNLHAGNFLLTRPWQLHKFGNPNIGRGRLHWLILDVGVRRPHQDWNWPKWVVMTKEDIAELTERWRHIKNPVWISTPAIAQSFRELARCITAWGLPHAVSRMAIHLNLLLIGVLDALMNQQTHENEQLASRKRAVEMFLADLKDGRVDVGEPWTLDRMASHCSMGVTAFSKYCRDLVNTGPMEFLNQCRLERAAQQLRTQPERSVTDIAFANGFNSSQYFATRFRRRFRVAPSHFSENAPARQSQPTQVRLP
ncbi:MAG TPA: AraC family transcriptional regulator, partial [Verrucomicrobiae bacterium]|nr:AraC family transcriptional regulator [Verrucomicrobiae bacterium]